MATWRNVGAVTIGHYPYEFLAFGVEDEMGNKILSATKPQYAVQAVTDHNAAEALAVAIEALKSVISHAAIGDKDDIARVALARITERA